MCSKLIKYSYIEEPTAIEDLIKGYVENRTLDAIVGCLAKSVYEDFLDYCKDNNIRRKIVETTFRINLYKMFNLTSSPRKYKGKSVRIIVYK